MPWRERYAALSSAEAPISVLVDFEEDIMEVIEIKDRYSGYSELDYHLRDEKRYAFINMTLTIVDYWSA